MNSPSLYTNPATKFNFNSVQDINSHSASLYNERMSVLFIWIDIKAINMNTYYTPSSIIEMRALLKQVYKNMRALVSGNPTMRATMNLETKEEGIYITDFAFAIIDRMIDHCHVEGWTTKKANILVYEINNLETVLKNILQYYHYFIRPNFIQKPDVNVAVEKYKEMADERTVDELRALVGKNHHIDFENLGKLVVPPPAIEDGLEPLNLSWREGDKDYYAGDENAE